MNNQRRFHLLICIVFLAIGFYLNNIYRPQTPNFLSEMGVDLFRIPVIISLLYIFRKKYLLSNFRKDILFILGFQLLIYIPDFWIRFGDGSTFILYKLLGLGASAAIAYLTFGIYEKSLRRQPQIP